MYCVRIVIKCGKWYLIFFYCLIGIVLLMIYVLVICIDVVFDCDVDVFGVVEVGIRVVLRIFCFYFWLVYCEGVLDIWCENS